MNLKTAREPSKVEDLTRELSSNEKSERTVEDFTEYNATLVTGDNL